MSRYGAVFRALNDAEVPYVVVGGMRASDRPRDVEDIAALESRGDDDG